MTVGATYDRRSPTLYLHESLDEKRDALLITYLECDFDVGVDDDNNAILKQRTASRHYTRMCVIKTATYPLEAILGVLLLDLNARHKRHSLQRSIFRFLFRTCTLEEFMADIVKYA